MRLSDEALSRATVAVLGRVSRLTISDGAEVLVSIPVRFDDEGEATVDEVVIEATGTARGARLWTEDGAVVADMTVDTENADLVLDDVMLMAGGRLTIETLRYGWSDA